MSTLVYNAIRTPDGTVLESMHRHDYNVYVDKNGKEYKLIQAGQDWSDSDTWVGLILALLTLAVPLSGLYFRWWN